MALDEFKEFIKKYPKLKSEVRDNKRTWQNIYEDWKLIGDDGTWDDYKNVVNDSVDNIGNNETIKTLMNYAKKINPNTITNALGTAQKFVGMFQAFNSNKKNQQSDPKENLFGANFKGWD